MFNGHTMWSVKNHNLEYRPKYYALFSCEAEFYDIGDTKTRRTTGLGYGRRFESMLNKAALNSPPPDRYTLNSDFKKQPKSRAFSFGISREYYKAVYIKENL
jgi:hypothetical protein